MEDDQNSRIEFHIKEVEVQKLNLKEDDVLMVKIIGNDYSSYGIESFKKYMDQLFPRNKVVLLVLRDNTFVNFEVIQTKGDQ